MYAVSEITAKLCWNKDFVRYIQIPKATWVEIGTAQTYIL